MANMRRNSSDRLLLGIVAGIVILIIVAFWLVLTQPEPAYQEEVTPEGVAHNYLLALRQDEFGKAYGYLSTQLENYPEDLDTFVDNVEANYYGFWPDEDVTLEVLSASVVGEKATVQVHESRFSGDGLFEGGMRERSFEMELRLEEGNWKIVDSDGYWHFCWNSAAEWCRRG